MTKLLEYLVAVIEVRLDMNNHNLIMEGWRKFLKESRSAVTEIQGKPIHMFFYSKNSPEFKIILYILDEKPGGRKLARVIGGVECIETEEPCIPKTLQVGTSYRDSDFAGMGLGPLLYDLAFFIAQSMGYALTSDRETGSKRGARDRWEKIQSSPAYEKQTTKAGNDKFDYYGETPDPDDDCTRDEYENSNATDHSFFKKDTGNTHDILMKLEANHMDYLDSIGDPSAVQRFLKNLKSQSNDLFSDEYDMASY